MSILLTTIAHRPYVFAFLISFLVIGFLNRGLGRTLLFLALGFSIAFLSEVSSIRNGFPYGMYVYVYENMKGEAMLWGVPLWDSLSYSFLAYAAYEYAAFYLPRAPSLIRRGWGGGVLAAILMVLLDVATDPLAVRGSRWFLGHIFYYPNGGAYFGVPLTNFGGWLLVALCIFGVYLALERRLFKNPPPLRAPWLGPAFYWGILSFNLLITFWIGEWTLGAAGLGLHLTSLAALSYLRRRRKES
ncbi:MAG TPA: carotenoid biosynthesis protein [bacterium]|nr:carotenoid biosynthesis protein [bacterium]